MKSNLQSTKKEYIINKIKEETKHFTMEGIDLFRNKLEKLESEWNTEETFKNNREKDIDELISILKKVRNLRLKSLED